MVPCCSRTSRIEPLAVERLGHVAHDRRRAGELGDERVEPVLPPRRDHDRRAGGMEHAGESIAEPR